MKTARFKILSFVSCLSGLFSIASAMQPNPNNLQKYKNSNVRDNLNSYGSNIHKYAQSALRKANGQLNA